MLIVGKTVQAHGEGTVGTEVLSQPKGMRTVKESEDLVRAALQNYRNEIINGSQLSKGDIGR
jgi:hypothetical protein